MVQSLIAAAGSSVRALMNDLRDGKITLSEAVQRDSMQLIRYKQLSENLAAYQRSKLPSAPLLRTFRFSVGGRADRFVDHAWQPGVKGCQLFVFGPSNSGKSTSFLDALISAGYSGFPIPFNDDWTGYHHGAFSFIYGDDFRGGIPARTFLQLSEGRPIRLNTKGGGVNLSSFVPVVITTTRRPDTLYRDMEVAELFNRFVVIELVGSYPDVDLRVRKATDF